jgi:hypothetical protein
MIAWQKEKKEKAIAKNLINDRSAKRKKIKNRRRIF